MHTHNALENMQQLLDRLARVALEEDGLGDEDTPAAMLMRDFLSHSWQRCQEVLLSKTSILVVEPEPGPAPRVYHFEVHCPYKRKLVNDGQVELMPGPVRGMIHYRADMFATPNLPYIAVQIDPRLGYYHPNCSRLGGSLLCLGEIPPSAFPFALDLLLENHIYPIVTYQNRQPAQPFDEDAARYFALDPQAMDGLEPVAPLY